MDISTLGEDLLKVVLKEVILRLKKHYTSEVDNGLDEAFQLALADWSKHTPTTSDKVRLSKALEGYIKSSTSYEVLDEDTRAFIDCFKKRLSEQPAAHNYLMTLRADMQEKSEEQNLLEHHKTQASVLDLKSRMEELNMAPQYVRALLKELPLEQGLECTESALEEMLANGRIHSEGAKRLVLEFVRFLFEHTDKISEEVKRLREAGDSYLAETLEEINKVLTGESEQSLTAVYQKYQEQERQNGIRVLKELIEAAQIQFSFGEAREFYDRLIELSPTSEHHFSYAHLLQSLNDFDKARSHYEEVLQVHRELSEQNPEVYNPKVAMILNNLGNLLSSTNELRQAQAHLEEAIQIYRGLLGHNPEAYKTALATILNNMGNLLKKTNDLKQAQTYYEESLQIYRELSEQNPEVHKSGIAMTLNNLGILLNNANEVKHAQTFYKEALQIYRELSRKNSEAHKPHLAITLNNLGSLLLDTHEYNQAQACYEEALEIWRELSEQNPEAYKPRVAATLNNLSVLLSDINELQQARVYYEEALQTRRELAENNPEVYKPDVAITLNNLAIFYLDLKDKEGAEKAYQEAHDIYKDLASRHPRAYGIDYAKLLVMGFDLLDKPKEDLKEAKAILDKYPEHPKAQELLSHIEELANG